MAEASKLTTEAVLTALRNVKDPELHQDLVSLGMIKDLSVEDGRIRFQVELTTPACPLKATIQRDCERVLRGLPGVREVAIEFGARVRGTKVGAGEVDLLPTVKNVILIASGKGGVGKSTVAVNIAAALAKHGAATGLLDADIYGPSIPIMLGVEEKPGTVMVGGVNKMTPVLAHGIPLMSIGFFVDAGQPIVWRGPMLGKALTQFMQDVHWGDLDYLVVDLPPGTGDVQITFSQQLKVSGAVLVTTPQKVALADVVRGKAMFDKVRIPVFGVVENMSYFVCDGCNKRHFIFDKGGGERAAAALGVDFLGEVPLVPQIREHSDDGVPTVVRSPESPAAEAFLAIASKLAVKLALSNARAEGGIRIVA